MFSWTKRLVRQVAQRILNTVLWPSPVTTWLSDFIFTFHFPALEKEWQPTPVFLPGESQGWGSLVGCCLWGRTESDMTEVTSQQQPVTAHWVTSQQNLCQMWKWTFSAPLDKIVMKCPQNHGQAYDHERALPTRNWHLPSTSTKIKSWPLQLLTFNISERSSWWISEMKPSVFWEKLAEQAFR